MSKLKSEAFPYPILTNDEDGDYYDSIFESDIELDVIDDEEKKSSHLKIKYFFLLENDEINNHVKNGEADFALLLISGATGYRELFYTNKKTEGSIDIRLSDVYGKLEILPQIIITADKVEFTSKDLNIEFTNDEDQLQKFDLTMGDPIAFSDRVIKYVSFEPLTLKSLLRVSLDNSLNEDVYSVDSSHNDFLTINMGENFKRKWEDANFKKYLMSSVIKDAILFSLKEYLDNKDDVENKRWASLILEKFRDIDEDQNDLRDDLDKLNQIALQIASKYTLDKDLENLEK